MSLSDYAWFVPGVLISALLALVLGGPLGRRIRAGRPIATLLLFSLGTVLAATVTPSREALMGAPAISSGCDLSRIGPAAWRSYAEIGGASLNVLLLVPLGVALGLLPRGRLQGALIVAAVLLPFGVEALQLVAAPLGRQCQAADVSDNLIGLVLGLVLGLAVAAVRRRG